MLLDPDRPRGAEAAALEERVCTCVQGAVEGGSDVRPSGLLQPEANVERALLLAAGLSGSDGGDSSRPAGCVWAASVLQLGTGNR